MNMSFMVKDIAGMLKEYEADHHTGMDIEEIATLIYDYTSGYPFLVSRLCQVIDQRIAGKAEFADLSAAWTKEGLLAGLKILLAEKNALFESLVNKLTDYQELREVIYALLFNGLRTGFLKRYFITCFCLRKWWETRFTILHYRIKTSL